MDSTSNIIQPQIDNKSNISQPSPINTNQVVHAPNQNNLNKTLILIIIILLLVIVAGGGYFYFLNQQQLSLKAKIMPQPNETPQSITTPVVTDTITDTTVVAKYKTISFKIGNDNGSPIKAQISAPDTWISDESSILGEGFDEGFERITFTLKAGNDATLTISNIFDTAMGMNSSLPNNSVLVANITNSNINNNEINSVPSAIYRVIEQKTGKYLYFTASKGKYNYYDGDKYIEEDGWYHTSYFYNKGEKFFPVFVSLSLTSRPDKQKEILALFDKIIQSFKML
jgi:hypothetical protein